MKRKRSLFLFFGLILNALLMHSQTTSSCFEIEGILVDACGNDEGNNEMVRFLVGPAPLNTSHLQVTWATSGNPWGGVCQNSSTAQKVAQLNSTIKACGFLKEPTGGVLPANSKVLLISGFDFDPANNSFEGLADTVYIIFNCASPGSGNFANVGTGIRTFEMSFSSPSACSDQVQYDRSKLTGGNGAAVSYTFSGTATYFNNGCNVPFTPLSAAWNSPGLVCGVLDLAALISGTPGGVFSGQGVSGSTFNPSGLLGDIELTYTVGNASCSVSEKHTVTVSDTGSAEWSNPGPLCAKDTSLNLNLLLSGKRGGVWSGSGVMDSIFNPAGLSGAIDITYTLGSGACQTSSTQAIDIQPAPPMPGEIQGLTEYCSEAVSALQVSPDLGLEVRWYSDSLLTSLVGTGLSYLPDSGLSRTYYAIHANAQCVSEARAVRVNFHPVPAMPQAADTAWYCTGTALPALQATGTDTLIWYSDEQLLNQAGTGTQFQALDSSIAAYFVLSKTEHCTSLPKEVRLQKAGLEQAMILPEGPLALCAGESIILNSSTAHGNHWSNGDTLPQISINEPGTYILELTGMCNSSRDTVLVTDGSAKAGMQASPLSGEAPLVVQVTDQSIQSADTRYYVNGNPVNLSSSGTLTLAEGGMYSLKQVVNSQAGCKDSLSIDIEVIGKLNIEIPNSFSPNGDGFNETFQVKTTGVKEFTCVIFNRWGSKVHEFKGPGTDWDGKCNGKPASDGVYFYVFTASGLMGEQIEKNGSITLIR